MAEKKVEYKTSAQVAKIFGMTSKRVQQLTADGIIETEETPRGRRYNWDKTVSMYIDYLSDKAHAREKKESVEKLEQDKLEAEVAIKQAKSQMAQLELDELQGKMHRADDVEEIFTGHVLFLRSLLLAMPGKLAVDLSGTHSASEQADCVKREVYYILNNLAAYRYDAEEYRKLVMARKGWDTERGDDDDGEDTTTSS